MKKIILYDSAKHSDRIDSLSMENGTISMKDLQFHEDSDFMDDLIRILSGKAEENNKLSTYVYEIVTGGKEEQFIQTLRDKGYSPPAIFKMWLKLLEAVCRCAVCFECDSEMTDKDRLFIQYYRSFGKRYIDDTALALVYLIRESDVSDLQRIETKLNNFMKQGVRIAHVLYIIGYCVCPKIFCTPQLQMIFELQEEISITKYVLRSICKTETGCLLFREPGFGQEAYSEYRTRFINILTKTCSRLRFLMIEKKLSKEEIRWLIKENPAVFSDTLSNKDLRDLLKAWDKILLANPKIEVYTDIISERLAGSDPWLDKGEIL